MADTETPNRPGSNLEALPDIPGAVFPHSRRLTADEVKNVAEIGRKAGFTDREISLLAQVVARGPTP